MRRALVILSAVLAVLGVTPGSRAADAGFDAGMTFTGAVDPAAIAAGGGATINGETYGVSTVSSMNSNADLAATPGPPIGNGGALNPSALMNDPAAQLVNSSFGNGMYTFDPTVNPLITGSDAVAANPQAVIGSLDQSYSGCQTTTLPGSGIFETRTCQESRVAVPQSCNRTLDVQVAQTPSCTPGTYFTVASWINPSDSTRSDRVDLKVFCNPGNTAPTLDFILEATAGWNSGSCSTYPRTQTFSLPTDPAQVIGTSLRAPFGAFTAGADRASLKYASTLLVDDFREGWNSPERNCLYPVQLELLAPSGCDGAGNCTFRARLAEYWRHARSTRDFTQILEFNKYWTTITATFQKPTSTLTITNESWADGCVGLDSSTLCAPDAPAACIDGPNCRNINGLDVCRACWNYQRHYSCLTDQVTSTCRPLIDQACLQTGSDCMSPAPDGTCAVYNQTYRCQVGQGASTPITTCGNTMTCMNGNCFDTTAPPNQDFANAATQMQVLQEAGKDQDPNTLEIFKGAEFYCTKLAGGFSDCCGDNGWGQWVVAAGVGYATGSIGYALLAQSGTNLLTQCSVDELNYVANSARGLCHLVGSYCDSTDVLGGCPGTTYVEACCFNSKLARIVQEQGRVQLGKGWGTPRTPDCSGFSITELQALDFSTMDLSEYFNDIMAQAKALDLNGQLLPAAQSRIENYYNTGTNSIQPDQAATYDPAAAPPVQPP